jgi:hypothetical protein
VLFADLKGSLELPPRRPLPFRPGQALPAPGKREQADEHLATAAAMYREMDMAFWLAEAQAEMNNAAA